MDYDLNLYRLRVFCEVLERQSFTLAAEELGTTQPGVSTHIRALERAVGLALFDREYRRVTPTEAGQALYEFARNTLAAARDLQGQLSAFRDAAAGRVVIGANRTAGSYVLPALLSTFKQRHPKAEIVLRLAGSHDVCEAVLLGDVDLGCVVAGTAPAELVIHAFRAERLVAIAAPTHPLARRRSLTPQQVVRAPFVITPRGGSVVDLTFQRLAEAGATEPAVALELDNSEGVKRAVATGLGISVVFGSSVEQELESGQLVALPLTGVDLETALVLVHRPRKQWSPLQESLFRFLTGKPHKDL